MSKADDFIIFEEVLLPENVAIARKTQIVSVRNRRSGDELGQIRWYSPWRQYCFFPSEAVIFNSTCMERIAMEMRVRTGEHRRAKT